MFGGDDDDDMDDEAGGHTRYPVMPSLVAMQQMKNRLHLAYLGKKLMKWTAMATGKELRRLAFEMNTHYDDYGDLVSKAFLLLARARYFCPKMNVQILNHVGDNAAVRVQFEKRSITGVKVLDMNLVDEGVDPYEHLGMGLGGTAILDAKIAWKNLLKMMVMMLQEKSTFSALDEANKNATKKQNVLGKLVIPKIVKAIQYIWSELEEQEREESFRLKRFKQKKTKKTEREAEKRKLEILALQEGKPKEGKIEEEEKGKEEPHLIKETPKVRAIKYKEAEAEIPKSEKVVEEIPKLKKVKREAPVPEKVPVEMPETKKVTTEKPIDEALPTEEVEEEEEENICPCCVAVRELDEDTGTFICPICKLADDALKTHQEIKVNMVPCQTCLPEVSENKDRLEHIMAHVNQIIRVTQQYTDNKNAIENRTNLFSYTTITEKSEFVPYCIQCTCAHMRVTGAIRGPPEICPCDPPLESFTYKSVEPVSCTCDKSKPVKTAVCPACHDLPKSPDSEICPCDEQKPKEQDPCPCDSPKPAEPEICSCDPPQPPLPEPCPCDEPKPAICSPGPPKPADSDTCSCDKPEPEEPDPCACNPPQPPKPEPCTCDDPKQTKPCAHIPPKPTESQTCSCDSPKSVDTETCDCAPQQPKSKNIGSNVCCDSRLRAPTCCFPCPPSHSAAAVDHFKSSPKPYHVLPTAVSASCGLNPIEMARKIAKASAVYLGLVEPKSHSNEASCYPVCQGDVSARITKASAPYLRSTSIKKYPCTAPGCDDKPFSSNATAYRASPNLTTPFVPEPVKSGQHCNESSPKKPDSCHVCPVCSNKLTPAPPASLRSDSSSCSCDDRKKRKCPYSKDHATYYASIPQWFSVKRTCDPNLSNQVRSCHDLTNNEVTGYLKSVSSNESALKATYPTSYNQYYVLSTHYARERKGKSADRSNADGMKSIMKDVATYVTTVSQRQTPFSACKKENKSKPCSCRCTTSNTNNSNNALMPYTREGRPGPCWPGMSETTQPISTQLTLNYSTSYTREGRPGPCGPGLSKTVTPTATVTPYTREGKPGPCYPGMSEIVEPNTVEETSGICGPGICNTTETTTIAIPYTREGRPGPCEPGMSDSARPIATVIPYTREGKPGPCYPGMSDTIQPHTPEGKSRPCRSGICNASGPATTATPYTREGRPGPCAPGISDSARPITTVIPYTREGKPGPCYPGMSDTIQPHTREDKSKPCAPGICNASSPATTATPYTREGRPGSCATGISDSARPITTVIPYTREGKPGPCYPGMSDTIEPQTREGRSVPCGSNICSATSPATPFTREGRPGPCGPGMSDTVEPCSRERIKSCGPGICDATDPKTTVIPYTREGRPGPCYPGMSNTANPVPHHPTSRAQEEKPGSCGPGTCNKGNPIITQAMPYTREGKPGPCGPSDKNPFSRDPAVYYFVTKIPKRRTIKPNIGKYSQSEYDISETSDLEHLLRTTRSNVSTTYYTLDKGNLFINSYFKDSSTYVRTVHQQQNECNVLADDTSLESCLPSSTDLNSTESSYSLDSCIPSSILNLHSADYSKYLSNVYSNASTVNFTNIASTLSGKINLPTEKKNSGNFSGPAMTHSTVTVNYVICQSDIQAAINKASVAYLDRSAQAWPLLPKIQDQIKKASRAYLGSDNMSNEYFDPHDMGAAIAKASAPYLKNAPSVCSRSVESMSNAVFRLPSDRYKSSKAPSRMPTSRVPKWVNPNFMSVPSGISNISSHVPTASSSQVGKDICAPYFNATKSSSRVAESYPPQDMKSCSCKVASEKSSLCKRKFISTPLINAQNDMPSAALTCSTCSDKTKNTLPPIVSICSICCKCTKSKDLPPSDMPSSITDTLQSEGIVYPNCDKCANIPPATALCSKIDTPPSGASVSHTCRKSKNLPVRPSLDTLPLENSVCSNCGKSKNIPPAKKPTVLEDTLLSASSICSNCGKSKNLPSTIIPLSVTEIERVCPRHSSKISNFSHEHSDAGYRETEFKKITKVSRYRNPDGTIVDEKQIITITTEKKTHNKLPNTDTIDVGTCISCSQEYDIDSQYKVDKKRSFECRPSHRDNKSDVVTYENDVKIIPKLKRCISAREYNTPNNILFGTWEAGPELEITVSRTPLSALMPCMSSNISCGNKQKCSANISKCICLSKGTSMTIINPTQQANVGNVNNKSNYGYILITPKPYKQFDTICANMLEDIRPKFNSIDNSFSTSIGIGPTYTDPVFAYILQNNSDISPAIFPGNFTGTICSNAIKPEDTDYGLKCSSAKISPIIATDPVRPNASRTEDIKSGQNCSCEGKLSGIDTDSDQKCSCPEASSCKSSGRRIANGSDDTHPGQKSSCAVNFCSVITGNTTVLSCPEASCFKPTGPQYVNKIGDNSTGSECICPQDSPSIVSGIDPTYSSPRKSPSVDPNNNGLVHIVSPSVNSNKLEDTKNCSKCICPGELPKIVKGIESESIWPTGSHKIVTGIDPTCSCPTGSPSVITSIALTCTSVRSCPEATPCMQLPTDSLHNKRAEESRTGLESFCPEESAKGVTSNTPNCCPAKSPSVVIGIDPTCSCPELSSSAIAPTSITTHSCLEVSCYTLTDPQHGKGLGDPNSDPECVCPETSFIDPMCNCPIPSILIPNYPRCANCGGKLEDTDIRSWLSSCSSNNGQEKSSLKETPPQHIDLTCTNCGVKLEDADLKPDCPCSSSSSSDNDLKFGFHKTAPPICIDQVCANCGHRLEDADFKTKTSFAFSNSNESGRKSCCTKATTPKSTSLVCAKCGDKLEETYSGPKCSCADRTSSVLTGIEPKCSCPEGAPCIINTQLYSSGLKDTVSVADCTRPSSIKLKEFIFPPSCPKESLYASINSVRNIIQNSIERCLKCTGPEGSLCNQSECQKDMSYGSGDDYGTSTTNLVTAHIIVCESTLSNADSGVKCDCSSDHAMDKLIPLTTSDSCRLKSKPGQEITKVCGSCHTDFTNIKEMLVQSKQRIDNAISQLESKSTTRTNCSQNNSELINSTEQSCSIYNTKSNEDAIKPSSPLNPESTHSYTFSALEAIKNIVPDIPAIKFLNVASSTSDLTPIPPKTSTPAALWKDLSKIMDTKCSKGQCTVKLTRKAAKTRCCQKKDEEGIFFKGSFLESLRKILLLAKTPRLHRDRHNNPKICKPCYSPVSASFHLKVYPPPCSVCDVSQSDLDDDGYNAMDIKPNTATPSCKSIGVGTIKRSSCCNSKNRSSGIYVTPNCLPIPKQSESCPKCNKDRFNNLVRSFSTPNSNVQPSCCANSSETAKKTNDFKPIRKGKIIHICTTIRPSDHMCHSESCISNSESRHSVKKAQSYHEDFFGF